jgi:UDP-N-acetylglucosamine 4-epimerase
VIPAWITNLVGGRDCLIHGDGSQTRDFCHVANVVQANILAACVARPVAPGTAYNVALGGSTNLNDLYAMIASKLAALDPSFVPPAVRKGPPRLGDILHSSADISKIQRDLGFAPAVSVDDGLTETVAWYRARA